LVAIAGRLANFHGATVPFAVTEAERRHSGDSRLSVEERYASRDEYLGRYARVAMDLAKAGFILPQDLAPMLSQAEKLWDYAMEGQTGSKAASAAEAR
jgi:hypothetical protein